MQVGDLVKDRNGTVGIVLEAGGYGVLFKIYCFDSGEANWLREWSLPEKFYPKERLLEVLDESR